MNAPDTKHPYLPSLIKELEAAEAGNIDLDASILCVIDNAWYPSALIAAPPYTTSIDAAVGLCERLLPKWAWDVGKDGPVYEATVWADRTKGGLAEYATLTAPSAPIALVIATLKAYEAQSNA